MSTLFLGVGFLSAQTEVVHTPIERDGAGMLIVKVKLTSAKPKGKDREFRFVLDTGASRSAVDPTIPSEFFLAWRQAPLELVSAEEAGNHLGRACLCAAPLELNLIENWAIFTPGSDGFMQVLPEPDRPVLIWDETLGRGTPCRRILRVIRCSPRWTRMGLRPMDGLIQVGPLKGKTLTLCNLWTYLQRGEAHTWIVHREGVLVPLNCPEAPLRP